ncbi:uncharacterized protein LOC110423439 [Herrania umbratica]|uniref:Uncharacterized protein LOC110423439 n=1 Tax=Herrania umbratica TaxID=108875 RepID=A0A6J1B3Y6_9ROSI|nr:uncharacterized protein LOC110423439 [Herrania umbratica]
MKRSHEGERGKAVEVNNNNIDFFQDYSTSSNVPCKKHPQSYSVGVCAYCLKDWLFNLVSSDYGEQRFSSCSCFENSSNPRTSCTGEVGSVGRVSSSISTAGSFGVNGGLFFDLERKSGFSEVEPRKSGFDCERKDCTFKEYDIEDIRGMRKSVGGGSGGGLLDVDGGFNGANKQVFSLKESYFTGGDDLGFNDLKFNFQSESKGDVPAVKKGVFFAFSSMRDGGDFMTHKFGGSINNALVGDGAFCNGVHVG